MKPDCRSIFLLWPLCVSAVLLIINDHLLKYMSPGWITGKLSDFSGIFLVTLILLSLLKGRAIVVYAIVGIAFLFWKSPYSQPLLDVFNHYALLKIYRTVDYSDLISFLMMPVALRVYRNFDHFRLKTSSPLFRVPVIVVTVLAITGTSMITPHHKYSIRKADADQGIDGPTVVALITEVAKDNGLRCVTCDLFERRGEFSSDDVELNYYILPEDRGVEFELIGAPSGGIFGGSPWHKLEDLRRQLVSKLGHKYDDMEFVVKLNNGYRCSMFYC